MLAPTLLAGGLTALAATSGCGEEEKPKATLPVGPATTTTGGNGGDGGNGGAGGADGGGGSGASGGAGGNGGSMFVPPEDPCAFDGAFGSTGIAFLDPTPFDLAQTLDQLTFAYQPDPRSLAVALLASHGPGMSSVAVSTSILGAQDQQFPPGLLPDFVPVALGYGEFGSLTPQATGWLRVVDDNGPVDIELNNITLNAETDSDCQTLLASVDATIPGTQADVTLTVGGNAATVGELAGPLMPMQQGWQIQAIFEAESISFNFAP
jgi:hypothetical protein